MAPLGSRDNSDKNWHRPLRGDFDEASGYRAMAQLLQASEPPQAVFFANDQMALEAIAAAHERGARVPEEVAIVGFDDIQAAAYVQPPLTTVRQEIRWQGVLAVQQLLQHLDEPELEARTTVLPTRLVVRRSCGCDAPAQSTKDRVFSVTREALSFLF